MNKMLYEVAQESPGKIRISVSKYGRTVFNALLLYMYIQTVVRIR